MTAGDGGSWVRRLPWPTLITVPALIVLIAFGTWQVQRLHWKEALIAEREARLAAPLLDIADIRDMRPALEHRRIRAAGTFLHDREMLLVARSLRGRVGVRVVTPLVLPGGDAVLVDRGWVPRDRIDPASRAGGQTPAPAEIIGILRAGGRPSSWTPDNQPQEDVWHFIDIPAMAARSGLQHVRDFAILAGPAPNPGGFPVGTRFAVEISNNHLQYAVTWYALAAVLAAIYLIYHLGPKGAKRRGTE
jgi:surfeit locus 1 family protein